MDLLESKIQTTEYGSGFGFLYFAKLLMKYEVEPDLHVTVPELVSSESSAWLLRKDLYLLSTGELLHCECGDVLVCDLWFYRSCTKSGLELYELRKSAVENALARFVHKSI